MIKWSNTIFWWRNPILFGLEQ